MNSAGNRPLKSSEWVMNDLRERIGNGSLAPGARLPSVVELSVQYQVGRSTVREALSALKAMGMLTIRQGGGTFVHPEPGIGPAHPGQLRPDSWVGRASTIRHILDVRRVLETGCALLAAKHRTEEDLTALAGTLSEMERALGREAESEQADVRFHQQIAAAARNPVLSDWMASLSRELHESMKDTRALWFYAERANAERLLAEHRAIYEAIARKDPQLASDRMARHIDKVEQVLEANRAGIETQ
ncbi:FadR/GntR family transcriptional regulator [Cohnella nanjingensis]|uniref:FadR family transcriptional regulator n=1 Tax=Cohnella nanjingensis TaxID=1387779 RepID=A0A7X0RLM6_9BACL|nr:FadR/GntR family transcriptional regulator [Cohnella nanjingensis]MBB6669740.1 FadR family transcriptional regulator [Cohnella nanjingensis]